MRNDPNDPLKSASSESKKRDNAIEITNVHKSFRKGKYRIFRGINLEIKKGDVTFLLGPSGAGKSVMFKHILGLLTPDEGEIRILGSNIPYQSSSKLNDMRKNFGMLFQNSALFDDMTVFENVSFPLKEHRKELSLAEMKQKVEERLRDVGLDPGQTMDKYPSELSGGMKKRVGLARAVVLEPQILLYDEPTTGLDPVTRSMVDDLIVETNKKFNLTSFVISHDILSALYSANHIAFLSEGKIVFYGSPEEFKHTDHPIARRFIESEERHRKGLL